MTRPKRYAFHPHKLEERKKFSNGVRYEHWHDTIDNEHHIHLPDGMLIIFDHEDCEGGVKIVEGGK